MPLKLAFALFVQIRYSADCLYERYRNLNWFAPSVLCYKWTSKGEKEKEKLLQRGTSMHSKVAVHPRLCSPCKRCLYDRPLNGIKVKEKASSESARPTSAKFSRRVSTAAETDFFVIPANADFFREVVNLVAFASCLRIRVV